MKNGPFIFVTTDAELLAENHTSVVSPKDVNSQLMSSLQAVIYDERLDDALKAEFESICERVGIPNFHWHPPSHVSYSEITDHLLEFLTVQNEWRNEPPSDETVEAIERRTLVDIITTANSLLEPKDVMQTVMGHIHELIPCEAWSVLMLDNNEANTLSFTVSYGPGNQEHLETLKVPFGEGIAGWVAKHRKPAIVDDAQSDPRFLDKIDKDIQFVTRNILCAPLVSRGRSIGVIEMINSTQPGGFNSDHLELVRVLVNPAAVAIENAYLFQKAQRLTIQDDLTKLYNSRHLNHCLEMEMKSAKREDSPLGLIFLDLDGFKSVNDNYGHLVGSQALIDIAEIISGVTEEGDIVGRYGGDEFVVIMPGADREGATRRAKAIGERVAAYRMKDMQMTASIGVALFPEHATDKETLVRLADKAMYAVKNRGKNAILFAEEL